MSSTQTLIEHLAHNAKPIKPIKLHVVCGQWLLATAVWCGLMLLVFGVRSDIMLQLTQTRFVLELTLNTGLMLASGLLAVCLGYPDLAHGRHPVVRLLQATWLLCFIGYSALLLTGIWHTPNLWQAFIQSTPWGLRCLLCIVVFAIGPAAFMFWRLHRLACVRPGLAGAITMLMAATAGCLGVLLEAQNLSPAGVVLWHYVPLWGFAAVGYGLGQHMLHSKTNTAYNTPHHKA